jgi:hypothetical protein
MGVTSHRRSCFDVLVPILLWYFTREEGQRNLLYSFLSLTMPLGWRDSVVAALPAYPFFLAKA